MASNISCKRVGGQEIIERCHEDISVKKKYIIALLWSSFFVTLRPNFCHKVYTTP